jgi:hypothetical protein
MLLTRNRVLFPLVVAAACGGDAEPGPQIVVRDSAGIEIVESSAERWTADEAWLVQSEPRVRIGLTEGAPEYLFSNIEGALLLADGRIAVADRGSSELRFYTADGVFERAIGGPGEGPGEMGYIRDLGRCGADSLFVFEIDFTNVVFTASGDYVREARPYEGDSRLRRPYALRCATNGHYAAVGWENLDGPRSIGFYRAESDVWILAPTHASHSTAAESVPGASLAFTAELGTMLSSERIGHVNGSRPHPFGRALRFAVSEDAVYLGTGEAFELRRYSWVGHLDRLIRWPGTDLTIRDADLAAYRAAQLDSVSPDARPALERTLMDMPMPPAFPAFQRIEVDPEGNLWIEEFRRPGQLDHRWIVIHPDGALLGTVALPGELVVFNIGSNAIIGVTRDALGVERVQVHDLHRPSDGRHSNGVEPAR